MQNHFEDKTVLVTGGSSGIGFEIVKRFVEEGARVITCGRDADKGNRAVQQLSGKYQPVFRQCDVGVPRDIEALFRFIQDEYRQLDMAVNNAGVFCMGKALHQYSLTEYSQIININLTGTLLCMQQEISMMLPFKHGSIVNIISTGGIGAQTYGSAPYIISKHGEVGLTKVAALEYAELGIRMNAVLPGMTDTELLRQKTNPSIIDDIIAKYPMKRLIKPVEVAEAALFLSSDAASAINGVLLIIDEGKSAKT